MCNGDPNGQKSSGKDEIKFLMTEHLEYSKQVDGIVKFAATVTAALLAVAFSDKIPNGYLIALSPLLVLWPLHSLAMNKNCNMVRIATYVRAFSGDDWQYEKRLKKFRNAMKSDKDKKNKQADGSNQKAQSIGLKLREFWKSYEFANNGIFIILGFLSIGCSFILASKELKFDQASILKWIQDWIQIWDWLWPIFIPLFSLILWLVYWLINKRIMKQGGMGNDLEDNCFELWENISPEDQ